MVDSAPIPTVDQKSKKDPAILILSLLTIVLLATLALILFNAFRHTLFPQFDTPQSLGIPIVTPPPQPPQISKLLQEYPFSTKTKNGVIYLNHENSVFIIGNLQRITSTDVTLSINGNEKTFPMTENTTFWRSVKVTDGRSVKISQDQLPIREPVYIEANINEDNSIDVLNIQIPYKGQLDQ